jgi:hypothetical protein
MPDSKAVRDKEGEHIPLSFRFRWIGIFQIGEKQGAIDTTVFGTQHQVFGWFPEQSNGPHLGIVIV